MNFSVGTTYRIIWTDVRDQRRADVLNVIRLDEDSVFGVADGRFLEIPLVQVESAEEWVEGIEGIRQRSGR